MANREKVISDLEEQITWIRDNDFHKFPGWGHAVLAMRDALALLKEQEPVVRCSECKYAHMTYDGECKYCDFWQEDGGDALYLDKGFYCAAGERRDGDT